MKYKNICVYPTTQMVTGQITVDEWIEKSADSLYDEWVCDYRWEPEDVKRLIDIAVKRRNETQHNSLKYERR